MTERIDFGEFSEDLGAAIRGVIETADVARVISYDRATQTASVQPVTQRRELNPDTDESEYVDAEIINKVPVAFPQAGGFSITWDLNPGDDVLVVYVGRSVDEWAATGSANNQPADVRRQDVNDAIILAGVSSPQNPLSAVAEDAMVFGGPMFVFGPPATGTFLSRNDRVENELNALRDTVNDLVTAFNAHTHSVSGVTPGMGIVPSGGPVPIPTQIPASPAAPIGSTASDRVKGE